MSNQHQHRATDEQWAEQHYFATNQLDTASPCILEPHSRVEALELALRAQAGSLTTAEQSRLGVVSIRESQAMIERAAAAGGDHAKQGLRDRLFAKTEITYGSKPFIAKYILTAGNIQQDSFRYDQSNSNSVLFDLAQLKLGIWPPLVPGDNIKIAHRWGELPTIDVHSTTNNYRVESVSETENRAWTIRAVRVNASDSEPEPKPAADAQVGWSSVAADRVLALQDRIRDGSLTLADALKEINGEPKPAADAVSPRLTPEDLGGYAYSDPIARNALRAGKTQAELIQYLLADKTELLKQLFDAKAREMPGPVEAGGKTYIYVTPSGLPAISDPITRSQPLKIETTYGSKPFIAKYLLTAGNIQQDSFRYDQSNSNSVLFNLANLELGCGCLAPGDNIKIAHRWGELPKSGCYSTVNYKVESVSSGSNNIMWTIRAAMVDNAPEPAADAQPLTLLKQVAIGMAHFASMARPSDDATPAAGDLLRAIAAWLRGEDAGAGCSWGMVANLLDNEANR